MTEPNNATGARNGLAAGSIQEVGDGASAPKRSRLRDRIRPHLGPAIALSVVSLVLVLGHVATFTVVSPIDEASHFDYIVRFPDIPDGGDRLTQETMSMWACQGTALDFKLPACGLDSYDPAAFPGEGYSSAGTHPPLYYAVTKVIAVPLSTITGLSLFAAARYTGVFWLSAFLIIAYAAAMAFGASRASAFGAALLLGSSAAMITSAATLGNDVAAAIGGGLVLISALRFDGSRRRLGWLLTAVVVAACTKLTAGLGVGVVALYLVSRRVFFARGATDRRAYKKDALAAVGVVVTFAAISAIWLIRGSMGNKVDPSVIPQNQWFLVDGLQPGWLVSHLWVFLTPISDGYVAPYLTGITKMRLESLQAGVLLFGAVGTAMLLRSRPAQAALGWALLVMACLGGPAFVLLNYFGNGMYFPIAARYGYSMLAVYVATAAFAFRSRAHGHALVLVASVAVIAAVVQAVPFNVAAF